MEERAKFLLPFLLIRALPLEGNPPDEAMCLYNFHKYCNFKLLCLLQVCSGLVGTISTLLYAKRCRTNNERSVVNCVQFSSKSINF